MEPSAKRYTVEQLAKLPPAQAYDALLTQPVHVQEKLLLEMDGKLHSAMVAEELVRNLNARTAAKPD